LAELAAAKNCTISQFVLAWTTIQPGITSAIIGPRTLAQLQDNLGAIEVEINDDDRKRIDELAPPGSALAKFPNQ
jgi:aryl-alcohol dehydrogenase-like predicted oxidoreductase